MWPKEKEREREKQGGEKKKTQPVWSALLGCCYLAVYDIQIEGGLVWSEWGSLRAGPFPGKPRVPWHRQLSLLSGGISSVCCVTWRGAHEWLLNVCLAQASRAGREWPSRVRAEPANADHAVLELAPLLQFLKSAEQKSDYSPVMPVEAQEEGTLHWLNYRGRCSKSQNSKVCLTCGPWRQM